MFKTEAAIDARIESVLSGEYDTAAILVHLLEEIRALKFGTGTVLKDERGVDPRKS